jgi:hypothetical protein
MRSSRPSDQEPPRATDPAPRSRIGRNSPAQNPIAILVVATLAAINSACHIPILTVTPGVLGARFTLPESEWGPPDECLVIACYRGRANWFGIFPDPPRGAFFYRVLEPSRSGRYATPAKFTWFSFGLGGMVPITPYVASQCEPMHLLFSARGTYGVRDRYFDTERPPWAIQRKSPRVTRVRSEFRVTDAPHVEPALSMDCVLGYVLCRILLSHDPAHRRASPQHEAISRPDAERIARFVAEHAGCFSRTTQLLSRRLADRYEWNVPRRGFGQLSRSYAECREPRFEKVLSDFPEEERVYFERLREELADQPERRKWTAGWTRPSPNGEPGTCNVCGETTSTVVTIGRRKGHLDRFLADPDWQPHWRELPNGMIEINVCKECSVNSLKKSARFLPWVNRVGTCDVCGKTTSAGATLRRTRDQPYTILADPTLHPHWRVGAYGTKELDICRECYKNVLNKRKKQR